MKNAQYHREYYQNNLTRKEKVAERRKRIRLENVEYLQHIKANSPCVDCGIQYPPYVMQFDHLRDKEAALSSRTALSWSRSRLDEEIAKCEVVCANCHFERTHQRRINGSVAETD